MNNPDDLVEVVARAICEHGDGTYGDRARAVIAAINASGHKIAEQRKVARCLVCAYLLECECLKREQRERGDGR